MVKSLFGRVRTGLEHLTLVPYHSLFHVFNASNSLQLARDDFHRSRNDWNHLLFNGLELFIVNFDPYM